MGNGNIHVSREERLDLLQTARRAHSNFYLIVHRHTTATSQADLLHGVIVQLRVDGKHGWASWPVRVALSGGHPGGK